MLAVGCLFPVFFFIAGTLIGAAVEGNRGSIWGALIGLALGLVVPFIMIRALASARKGGRRP